MKRAHIESLERLSIIIEAYPRSLRKTFRSCIRSVENGDWHPDLQILVISISEYRFSNRLSANHIRDQHLNDCHLACSQHDEKQNCETDFTGF